MKTITKTYKVYKFDELSEQAQHKALEKLWDINVFHDWWECTYEDAKNIEATINGFDIGRSWEIDMSLDYDTETTCNAIIENHGEQCDTYTLAIDTLKSINEAKESSTEEQEEDGTLDEKLEDINKEFLQQLGQCYLIMLRDEYEYLTSEEAVKDTIEANDYDFLENGELYK